MFRVILADIIDEGEPGVPVNSKYSENFTVITITSFDHDHGVLFENFMAHLEKYVPEVIPKLNVLVAYEQDLLTCKSRYPNVQCTLPSVFGDFNSSTVDYGKVGKTASCPKNLVMHILRKSRLDKKPTNS